MVAFGDYKTVACRNPCKIRWLFMRRRRFYVTSKTGFYTQKTHNLILILA